LIEGVRSVSVPTYVDDRGYLTPVLQETDGLIPDIKRIYVCGNFGRGVVRGFHKHFREWKCFFICKGAAKFVLIDDREGSPTYKQIDTCVLSSNSPSVLIIPTGVYNGWMSLEEGTVLLGISSTVFDKDHPDDVRVDPFTFGDVWSVKGR